MKKILLAVLLTVGAASSGCGDSEKNYPVYFVNRSDVFPVANKVHSANPLMLVVEIGADKKLKLNKIETGTITDTTLLSEKIRAIFADRKRASIGEREVVIDPKGEIESADLEKLIESLAAAKASPIRVIKDNL